MQPITAWGRAEEGAWASVIVSAIKSSFKTHAGRAGLGSGFYRSFKHRQPRVHLCFVGPACGAGFFPEGTLGSHMDKKLWDLP